MILWALVTAEDLSERYLAISWPVWALITVAAVAAISAAAVCVMLGRGVTGSILAGAVSAALAAAPAWCLASGPVWESVLLLAPGCAFALSSGASPKALMRMICRVGWAAIALLSVGYEPSLLPAALIAGALAWTVGWAGRHARPLIAEVHHGAL